MVYECSDAGTSMYLSKRKARLANPGDCLTTTESRIGSSDEQDIYGEPTKFEGASSMYSEKLGRRSFLGTVVAALTAVVGVVWFTFGRVEQSAPTDWKPLRQTTLVHIR